MQAVPRPVSPPKQSLPPGACDSHAHVFGPFDRFPLYEGRRYTPPLAPVEDYLAMLDRAGSTRGVLIHPSASGWDCSCTLNALAIGGERLRGIVVVPPDVSDATLESLDGRGVRGIRFTETGDMRHDPRPNGVLGLDDFAHFSRKLHELNWHAQIWAKCSAIVSAAPELLRGGIPLVVDHMGFFEMSSGIAERTFQEFLGILRDGNVWVKLMPCRISKQHPDYGDARPFHDALLRVAPERMIWGSDWPYIGLDPSPPNVGTMIDVFDSFTSDKALRDQVLVANPAVLYGF